MKYHGGPPSWAIGSNAEEDSRGTSSADGAAGVASVFHHANTINTNLLHLVLVHATPCTSLYCYYHCGSCACEDKNAPPNASFPSVSSSSVLSAVLCPTTFSISVCSLTE